MKLTRDKLKQIIKEELEEMMSEKPKIEDFVLGTYQGKEYAANEDVTNLKNFQLFELTPVLAAAAAVIVASARQGTTPTTAEEAAAARAAEDAVATGEFLPVEPFKSIPKSDFDTDWDKTAAARAAAATARARAKKKKNQKTA